VAGANTSLNEASFTGGAITGVVFGIVIVAHGSNEAYNWRFDNIQYIAALGDGLGGIGGPAIQTDDGVLTMIVSNSTIESASSFAVQIQGSTAISLLNNWIWSDVTSVPDIDIEQGNSTNANTIKIDNNVIGYTPSNMIGTGQSAIRTTGFGHKNIMITNNTMFGTTLAMSWGATGTGGYIANNYIDPASGASGKPNATSYGSALRGSTWFTNGGAGADAYEVLVYDGAAYSWKTLF